MSRITVLAALALAGCATTGETPEPEIVTQTVVVRTPVACVPDNLGKAPAYPDTDAALAAAIDLADRYALLWAGRISRNARLGEVEPVITACREAAGE